MTKEEKFEKLNAHIGWEQVSDTHTVDAEIGVPPSAGDRLARLLIENAQNQTGISLEPSEHEELKEKVKSQYC